MAKADSIIRLMSLEEKIEMIRWEYPGMNMYCISQ
jgi:hypothetical protein